MNAPTAADIREWSKVDWSDPDLDYPPPTGADPDPLQRVVDLAVAYISFVTARPFDASVPVSIESLMNQAVQMRTEQIAQQLKADNVETAGDIDMIGSFTAGAYSETRHDPTRRGESRSLNPWPALNDLLWLLLGLVPGEVNDAVDQQRDYWRYILGMQPNAPAWQLVEMNWRRTVQPDYRLTAGYGIGELAAYEPWHGL